MLTPGLSWSIYSDFNGMWICSILKRFCQYSDSYCQHFTWNKIYNLQYLAGVYEENNSAASLPLPDLPTNLRSLKRATWFLKVAVAFLRSAALFSSLPAVSMTFVPSKTSLRESTLNGTGKVLLQRQWEGRIVQTKLGLLVRTNSPGYSAKTSENVLSPRKGLEGSTGWWLPFSVGVGAVGGEAITIGIGSLFNEGRRGEKKGTHRRAANTNRCNQLLQRCLESLRRTTFQLHCTARTSSSRPSTAHITGPWPVPPYTAPR